MLKQVQSLMLSGQVRTSGLETNTRPLAKSWSGLALLIIASTVPWRMMVLDKIIIKTYLKCNMFYPRYIYMGLDFRCKMAEHLF